MNSAKQAPQTSTLDWANLGFTYVKAPFRFQAEWDGGWSEGELVEDASITVEEGACAIHYGQQCFEGLKAFPSPEREPLLFRPDMNGERMKRTAERLLMEPPPVELFLRGVEACVRANRELLPPPESRASLYIRPLLLGVGDNLGLRPASRYLFRVFCSPVGPYFKGDRHGISLIVSDFDRAAPRGTGAYKAGGNYAGALLATKRAKAAGYDEALFLDAATRTLVEEAGSANVFAVTKDEEFVAPDSASILPSVTMDSVLTLAREDFAMKVSRRPLPVDELFEVAEAGATGTAAGIAPIARIRAGEREVTYTPCPGVVSTKIGDRLRQIQRGEAADPHGWVRPVLG